MPEASSFVYYSVKRGLQMGAMHGQPYDQYVEKSSVYPFQILYK